MKKIITISLILIVLGLTVSVIGFAAAGFDVTKLSGEATVAKNYSFGIDELTRIEVDTGTVDVKIVESSNPGDSIGITVKCYETRTHSVNVADGKLTVDAGERPWYKFISIFSAREIIEILLPYGYSPDSIGIDSDTGDVIIKGIDTNNLNISIDTGDVSVENGRITNFRIEGNTGDALIRGVTASILEIETDTGDIEAASVIATDRMKLSCDTGDVDITRTEAHSIEVKTTTGDIEMEGVAVADRLSAVASTGDVQIVRCDAPIIDISTSTGDVNMSLLTPKIFDVDTSTGRKRIPAQSTEAGSGQCKVRTSTGDIEITIIE